jgi:tripartite-type tricarboxylate transporter receptor subunit TctC
MTKETPMRSLARVLTSALLALATLCALSTPALAQQDYPNKPVKWIVPYPPAGTTDVLARMVAQWLTEKMGQP